MPTAEYQRRYREAVPEYRERMNAYNRARGRALRQLSEAHPDQFLRLLQAEFAAEGYEWIGPGGPGTPKTPRNLGLVKGKVVTP